LNAKKRWACRCSPGQLLESSCLQIEDHILTAPLTREFLSCLDLTPHAEAVLEKLKAEVSERSLEESQRRRREAELKSRIANLERYLGCEDPEREETYWRLIREARAELNLLKQTRPTPKSTAVDIERVAHFLENLEEEWERYPSRLRNRLLTLLVDRVELRHDPSHIEATIVWKAGLRQVIDIKRPQANFSREKLWQKEEDDLLRMLWPSASREAILAALPGRTWAAINQRASLLKIKRERVRVNARTGRRWTREEKEQLKELYASGVSIEQIARKLQRSEATVKSTAFSMGVARPKELRHRRLEPAWDALNIKVFHESSSPP
jgi:hypothetical protein